MSRSALAAQALAYCYSTLDERCKSRPPDEHRTSRTIHQPASNPARQALRTTQAPHSVGQLTSGPKPLAAKRPQDTANRVINRPSTTQDSNRPRCRLAMLGSRGRQRNSKSRSIRCPRHTSSPFALSSLAQTQQSGWPDKLLEPRWASKQRSP